MKRKMIAAAVMMSMGLLWGCYPGGAEYADELDIVYSNYDEKYDFKNKGTYSLPDDIVKITGEPGEAPEYVKDVYAQPILQQIEAHMLQLGWTKVTDPEDADVNFLPAAWTSTTVLVSGGYGDYWCWYYPYYCGGGWYYPYYSVSSYTTGTFLMNIVDNTTESTDGSKGVVWTSAINGLLTGSYNADRVKKAIDQSFAQSPYLKTN